MDIRTPTEIQIQGSAWSKVWKEYHDLRRCFFHVPNESTYDNSQQKSSGVIPGIQDMLLLCSGRCWLMELKDDTGVVSREQKVVHAVHKVQGFDTYIFRDADVIFNFITDVRDNTYRKADFMERWSSYISPYSVAADYPRLLAELQAHKKAQLEKRKNKSYNKV